MALIVKLKASVKRIKGWFKLGWIRTGEEARASHMAVKAAVFFLPCRRAYRFRGGTPGFLQSKRSEG